MSLSFTKLFTGCLINSEIRMHLNSSIQWKHAVLSPGHEMKEIHYQGKDYFGKYLVTSEIPMTDLANIQIGIKEQLKYYCPKLETDSLKICIFPQVFVA